MGQTTAHLGRFGTTAALVFASVAFAATARADVVDSNAGAFTIRTTVTITKSADAVYDALVKVAQWWNPAHTFSGQSSNLTLDAKPGGCFCERLAGGGVQHMVVVYADRGKMLRMTGGLGPLQQMPVAAVWTLSLEEKNGQTTLASTYAVSGYTKDGFAGLAAVVDQVMSEQVSRLKQFAELLNAAEADRPSRSASVPPTAARNTHE